MDNRRGEALNDAELLALGSVLSNLHETSKPFGSVSP